MDIPDPEEDRKILAGIRERLAMHKKKLGIAEAYIIGLDVMITTYKEHLEHLHEGEHSVVDLSEMVPIQFKSIPFLGQRSRRSRSTRPRSRSSTSCLRRGRRAAAGAGRTRPSRTRRSAKPITQNSSASRRVKPHPPEHAVQGFSYHCVRAFENEYPRTSSHTINP